MLDETEPYDGAYGMMFQVRVGDLVGWHVTMGRCPRCFHEGPVDLGRLVAHLGALTDVRLAQRWIKCRRCGQRGGSIFLRTLRRPG